MPCHRPVICLVSPLQCFVLVGQVFLMMTNIWKAKQVVLLLNHLNDLLVRRWTELERKAPSFTDNRFHRWTRCMRPKSRQIGNKPSIPYILYEVTAPCTQSGNAKPCCILLVRLGVSPNGSHNQINILSGDNINGFRSSCVGAAF